MKKKVKIIAINIYKKIIYCIKYLWYLIKLLAWKMKPLIKPAMGNIFRFFTPKRLVGTAILVVIAIVSLISFPYIYKYVTTPKPPPLRSSPANARYLYNAGTGVKTKGSFKAYIGESKTNSPKVEVSFGKLTTASFVLTKLNPELKKPVKEGNKLVFPDVRNQVDLSYELLTNGVKEEIIVKAPIEGNAFTFDFNSQGAIPKKDFNGALSPFFYTGPDYAFHLAKPFAYDKKGARTDNVTYKIKKTGTDAEYQVTVIVDQDWLLDPKRVYPVAIDPTIVHDTTAEFATGQLNRLIDTGSGSSPNLTTNYQELSTDINTVGLWHMNETANDSCSGGQDACDSSGNGNHGTATGTTIDTTTQKLGAAARSFGGNSSHIVTVPDSAYWTFGTGDFSIELWTNPSVITGNYEGIMSTYDGSNGFILTTSYGTDGHIAWWNVTNGWIDTGVSLDLNTWQHLAVTRTSGTINIYKNGTLINTTAAWTGNIDGTTLTIGGWNASYAYLTGKLDEIRISKIARTPEEIKLDASRRPYSVYTSDVIDMTNVSAWNPLTWTELGVNTGDGETPYSTTGLVAQWNFNETSGTNANNDAEGTSCGGTPANCDGTLTGFDSTASQDADPDSSWTANNRRWGAGALTFDGIDSYIYCTDANCGGTSKLDVGTDSYTTEAWIKTSKTNTRMMIMSKGHAAGNYSWSLEVTTSAVECLSNNTIGFYLVNTNDTVYSKACGTSIVTDGNWHHVVGVWNPTGTTTSVYVDGKLDATSNTTSETFKNDVTSQFEIGRRNDGVGYFQGVIDTPRIYHRALTASEILSNYQAGNVELQTRVGADNSPDDGSWEAWKPTTGETAIDSYDSNPDPDYYYTKLLLHMDGTDASTAFPDNALIPKTFTVVGNAQIDTAQFQLGGASGLFDGTDNINTPDHTDWYMGAGDFSIDFWYRSTAGGGYVWQQYGGDLNNRAEILILSGMPGTMVFRTMQGGSWYSTVSAAPATLADNTWYHMYFGRNGNNAYIALNGTQLAVTGDFTGKTLADFTGTVYIGGDLVFGSYAGWVDEFRYSKGIARWTSNFTPSTTAYDNLTWLDTATDTTTKIEGTGSEKIISGRPFIDANTVALWHLNETGGTGAYIKDSTTNANNGTPTGTSVANGFFGKARSFNGTSDYITAPTISIADTVTAEAWVYSSNYGANMFVVQKAPVNTMWELFFATGLLYWRGGSTTAVTCTAPTNNQWHYVVGTQTGTTATLYIDGTQCNTGSVTAIGNGSGLIYIGSYEGGYYFNGIIDEVRLSSTARSAEEIAEAYRAGRDHYITKTLSSTDLSAKTSLPFYVASDRQGTFLQTMIGESAYANYQPDANTVGLWHLDEQSGTANAYLKDSSGYGNHSSTITGTTFTQGKIGKARNFNGSSDYLAVSDADSLDITNNFSISFWVKPTNLSGVSLYVLSKRNSGLSDNVYSIIWEYVNDQLEFYAAGYSGSNPRTGSGITLPDTNWHHVVYNYNGTTWQGFLDGKAVFSTTTTFSLATSTANLLFGSFNAAGTWFNGALDEFRIDNTARTADQIRQAYEVGARTHNITIDFKAALNSGNLIANTSDLSFTIDATAFGASSMGSNLYKGDKVIVKENYDGTEYIAQGTVTAVTASTGAVTVASWDSGSTVPSGGFTVNTTVFKWQREYFDLRGSLSTHRDAITNLTVRVTDGSQGSTVWLDDFRSSGGYLTTPGGSTVTSSIGNRYAQYRIIEMSYDPLVSSSITSATLNYTSSLAPPTGLTATALSTSSIRWNFTDTANDEDGFKVFDASNNLKATCAGANLTYCDETGLPSTPNTQYTRKVAVYNGTGTGSYSDTASGYTAAAVPPVPAVNTRTTTTINVIPSAGSNPSGTELAIYAEEGTTCDGSGGLGYVQTGGSISGTAAWATAATWGTKTVTGLNQEKVYSFCVKAKNGNGVETGFSPAYFDNGGYFPISGNHIITSSSNCATTSRYVDGNTPSRYICGVDSGSGGTNTAEMALQSGTFTIQANETLVAGKFTLSEGSLIVPNGAVIKPGSTMYVLDADSDGYPDNAYMYYGGTPPTNYRRKNLQTTLATVDCNSASGSQNTTCFVSATGGTITTSGNDKIHTFTSSGTFTVTYGGNVEALVVGGGGGSPWGYNGGGGGGGGGGYQYNASFAVTSGNYSVTVGAGGAAGGSTGGSSSFSTITATGGSACPSGNCTAGGSSGSPPNNSGGAGNSNNLDGWSGGGAAGAQSAGGAAGVYQGGSGGSGIANSISGSNVVYAGGGGGGSTSSGGGGGAGGGGNGACCGGVGNGGAANTGGGGGGNNSAGGSGIVIIRYQYQ